MSQRGREGGTEAMRMGRRVLRLEAKTGRGKERLLIVYEAEDGIWTTAAGERIAREELPATTQVIVFRLYKGGPQ